MKIRMKHNDTEIEIEDAATGHSNEMIHYNQTYLLKLLENMADQIKKIRTHETKNTGAFHRSDESKG